MFRFVRFVFVLGTLAVLWGLAVMAVMPLRARADDTSGPDVLMPTSGWLVGPAAIAVPAGVRDMPLPCVMINQFDNGFTLRLSGGGERLAALVIDFRQSVFTMGQRYPLRIFILPDYKGDFTATAYDASTLIVNLGNDGVIYRALAPANGMDLSIGPTVVRFDLTGLSDGLRRLESCFRPGDSSSPAPKPSSQAAFSTTPSEESLPPPAALPFSDRDNGSPSGIRTLPASGADPLKILGRSGRTALDREAMFSEDRLNGFTPDETSERTPSVPPQDSKAEQVWRASQGEDVQEVLSRWSRKEGVSLVWTARRQGRVGADFRYEGSFEEAVSAFLAQAGTFRGEIRAKDSPAMNVQETKSR